MATNRQQQRHGRQQRGRRQGQALLLAVLVMIFAALIGSTFITVISLNMSQTSRQQDRLRARSAARAGVNWADERLTHSTAGYKWRPEMMALPPAPGDPTYNFYYTPQELVHGWARTSGPCPYDQDGDGDNDVNDEWIWLEREKDLGKPVYIKFPDPRLEPVVDTPTFLAEVRTVASGDKRGDLQISIIGLSPDDPDAFESRVAYKGGPGEQPLSAAARSVTNWDFSSKSVPSGEVVAPVTSSTTLDVKNLTGRFPTAGAGPNPNDGEFYIVIGDPISNNVRGVAASKFVPTPGDPTTGTLTLATPVTALAGERVELAAGLGAPSRIDANADGAKTPATEDVPFKISRLATPGSVWVNGSLLWFGNAIADNLRSASRGTPTAPSGWLRASGLMCYSTPPTDPYDPTNVTVQNAAYQPQGSGTGLMNTGTLDLDSAAPGFPGPWTDSGGTALAPREKAQIVSDGWNRLAGDTALDRQNAPFTPPDITVGDGGGRYRQMTQFSGPNLVSGPPLAALYGYGEGIFINNDEDRERVYESGTGQFRDMTPDELHKLWLDSSPTPTENFARLGTPTAVTINDASLEQQHLRGWVGADEFRARGALIEIVDTDPVTGTPINPPKLFITRDSRNDGATPDAITGVVPNQGPIADKGWRDPSGALLGDGTLGGVYRQEFPWPKNGVIFAEGNLRVRGSGTNAPCSLTIVSMNNIYIEGSLNAGQRKVLLLALKNVVVNPTAVLARIDAQTRVRDATNPADTKVYDADSFRVGETVAIGFGAGTTYHQIAGITPNSVGASLQLLPNPSSVTNAIIHSPDEALNTGFGQVKSFDDALQRRFTASGTMARLAFWHSADRVTAFTLGAEESSPPSSPNPLLGVKVVPTPVPGSLPTTIVQPADKIVTVKYAGGTPGTDTFPATARTSQTDATAYKISDLRNEIVSARPMTGGPTYPWYYDSPAPATTSPTKPPFFYLAGIGNRYDGCDGVATGGQLRREILTTDYELPLATSVTLSLDGAAHILRGDLWNTALGTSGAFERVPQFGFNPTHGAGLTPTDPATMWEDALTVDQSFYTTDATDLTRFTLDSRVLDGINPGLHSLNLKFSKNSGLPGDADVSSYFTAPQPEAPPAYRLARMKLEYADQLNAGPNYQFEKLAPAQTLNINALVYAQEGSWIVLSPGNFDGEIKSTSSVPGNFDSKLKSKPGVRGTYLDANNNSTPDAGEYLDAGTTGTFDNGDYADLDRDGVISRAEQAAIYRFSRYNYKVNFLGSIMENQTALVNDPDGAGPLIGAVSNWMDAWSTAYINSANWSGTTYTGTFNDTLSYANGGFDSVAYAFDDTALRGFIDFNGNGMADPGETLNEDPGFNPPVMPNLIYEQ